MIVTAHVIPDSRDVCKGAMSPPARCYFQRSSSMSGANDRCVGGRSLAERLGGGLFVFSRGTPPFASLPNHSPCRHPIWGAFTFPCSKLFCFHASSGSGEPARVYFLLPLSAVTPKSAKHRYGRTGEISWLFLRKARQTVRILSVYQCLQRKVHVRHSILYV